MRVEGRPLCLRVLGRGSAGYGVPTWGGVGARVEPPTRLRGSRGTDTTGSVCVPSLEVSVRPRLGTQ